MFVDFVMLLVFFALVCLVVWALKKSKVEKVQPEPVDVLYQPPMTDVSTTIVEPTVDVVQVALEPSVKPKRRVGRPKKIVPTTPE